MSIWQVQVHNTTSTSGTSGVYVPAKIDEIVKELPNVFSITDDILIIGYDIYGKDHDRMLR